MGQPRPARLDHRRIDDLAAHRQPAFGAQQRVKPREQLLRRTRPRQLLAIEPDRFGVRHRVMHGQPDKPHERQPILQLILGLVVGQRVQRLQNQHLEHQYRVIGRSSPFGPIRTRQRLLQISAKHFEIDHRSEPFQRIPGRREGLQPLVLIKKSRLPRHRQSPHPPNPTSRQFAIKFNRFLEAAG